VVENKYRLCYGDLEVKEIKLKTNLRATKNDKAGRGLKTTALLLIGTSKSGVGSQCDPSTATIF
jgi:hypothetical protein